MCENCSQHLPISRRTLLKTGTGVLVGLLLPSLQTAIAQTDPKRIYIAPDDHTDYMWKGNEEQYRQAFIQMLDYYLDLTDATAHEPPEYQSRWNCDGNFWVWVYEKNKTQGEFERLIARIRDGHVTVPYNPLVILWGGAPAEAVLRGMYYAGKLERLYNLRFTIAASIENQTLPLGLVSLWAGAGVKYSWKGICNCGTRVTNAGDRQYEIYWWVGRDGSRILMKWNSQLVNNAHMGGYAEARNPDEIVEYVDTNSQFINRYPYRVIGSFGYGWDNLETYTDEFIRVAKDKTTPQRQVIVSNEQDFFEDFETTYGSNLPTVTASFGNEWELYCASMAEVSAQVKRLVEKLRAAEALATLVRLKTPNFMNGRESAREQAWMSLGLYWEHNWTADGDISRNDRAAWQRRLVTDIANYVNPLYQDATQTLAGLIQSSGSNPRFYAFNSLSWTRTDFADVPYSGTTPVHVIDLTTGQETPSQIVSHNGVSYLRILAKDVPSVGYKVFEIRTGAGTNFGGAATITGNIIENARYKITLANRGAITSLIDKTRNNREFVRVINGRAMNDLGGSSGSIQVENVGAVSATLVATAASPLNRTIRLTLIRDVDRIDIHNHISQNFGQVYTWNFGFELNSPDVWHEEVGAVLRARLTSNSGHYSPRQARYDWLTLNHFAAINGSGNVGMTLSNADCYYMKLGNSTNTSLDIMTPLISVLIGGQVDGSGLGIPNQNNDSSFIQRFALRSHSAFNAADSMRFALEHQNPFVTAMLASGGTAYPATSYSLVNVSNSNVLLWALKPAEDNSDIVARVWNLSSSNANFTLALPSNPISSAKTITHVETPIGEASVSGSSLSESVAAHQMKSFALTI